MEETMIQAIMSYGALGACTAYFMWKDATQNKSVLDALRQLTIEIETFIKVSHGDAE